MTEKVKLSLDEAKVKVEERSKGRMKITFKLNKESAEGFKVFTEKVKPDEVDMDTFYRHIFFTGIKTLDKELADMFEARKAELEKQKAEEISSNPQPEELKGNGTTS